jgi:hypothetical protein
MKNEKEFKKRISEIAARIAEADASSPSFDAQVDDLLGTLSPLFNKVRNEEHLADIISAMVKHMPVGKNKTAVSTGLRIAGKVANTDPAVSKDSPNAAYPGMPVPKELQGQLDKLKEYESNKVDLPDSIKAKINSAIADEKDMAQFVLDMIMEIIPNEKSLANIEKRAGWSGVFTILKNKAGEGKAKDGETPDVSPEDAEKRKLPDLQETYNRIKRK